jgi:predicted nucleotidyltransferase
MISGGIITIFSENRYIVFGSYARGGWDKLESPVTVDLAIMRQRHGSR